MGKKGGVNNMTKEVTRFTLRITRELKDKLDISGKKMGISLNSLVVQILWDWAERNQEDRG